MLNCFWSFYEVNLETGASHEYRAGSGGSSFGFRQCTWLRCLLLVSLTVLDITSISLPGHIMCCPTVGSIQALQC